MVHCFLKGFLDCRTWEAIGEFTTFVVCVLVICTTTFFLGFLVSYLIDRIQRRK